MTKSTSGRKPLPETAGFLPALAAPIRDGGEGVQDVTEMESDPDPSVFVSLMGFSLPVDEVQARLAREAFRHFGKGRHQAGLNFGDCFSYALAKSLGEPLLCTGKDFRLSDLAIVLGEQGQTYSG